MSTPIETNTEELNEILQTVYNLPNRSSGGSAEPDLVIGLNAADTDSSLWYEEYSVDNISIESGSISAVAEKVKQGLPVDVQFVALCFYAPERWFKIVGKAKQVSVSNYSDYPNENYSYLIVSFNYDVFPDYNDYKENIRIQFDLTTGEPIRFFRG